MRSRFEERGRAPRLGRWREGALSIPVATIAGLLASGCLSLDRAGKQASVGESWTLTVDNDSYNFDDGNYTNGVELLWISRPSSADAETSFARRVSDFAAGWPGMAGLPTRQTALGITHAVFTPESLIPADPAPGERPYAGVLLFDLSVLARDHDTSTAYLLRLGVVGDLSLAEELQKEIHPRFGAEDPQGWDTQLGNEPIANVGWVARRRWLAAEEDETNHFDITREVSVHAGTYYTGAGATVRFRFGADVPRALGASAPRTGFETHPMADHPESDRPAWFGFLDLEGHGVAHYLPVDGNVFRSSRSAEREPLVGKASLGLALGSGPWKLTLAYSFLSRVYEAQGNGGQFGSISLTWAP